MKLRRTLVTLFLAATAAMPALANITSTSLRIQGAGLRVVTESVTTGVDLPVTVQTEFGGKSNEEAVSIDGVVAVGELTGPGIETPIQLTTAPGYRFQIPGLSQTGVYYLQNVRLMKGTDFLQYASPATAVITVADLLQTKVTVKQLSPDEIRARGITIDSRNFDVFEYSFTFIIDGQEVQIPFPVAIDPHTHEVMPIVKETPYTIPSSKLVEPPRWSPPDIIATEFVEEGELPEPGQDPQEREQGGARPSIPAAIVIPNNIAVLHQFFAVQMMVTNGAPAGSAARLEDIKATIKIPTALRTVKTEPTVSFGAPVPIVEPTTGVTFLVAQSRGEAEWTLEGLQPGTHRIDFDLRATLKQEGQIDIPMRATPSAAVVVHDPRFNINFSHPDTVRKGIEYSTYAFITNMSGTEQSVTVSNGVESCDENPAANVCRLSGEITDLITIPANDMRVIEYRLRPGVTGHVFATAGSLSSTDNLSASVSLFMGVSETGIPLSPATLLMPYYAQFVDQGIVDANLQLFGLGYSLATAPLNQMTAKFPRVIKTDVFQRAVDVSRAGQRIFITDSNPASKRDAIANLSLDLLGNGGYELREWDALRRQEKSGRLAGASVMRELEKTALVDGATMTSFVDAFASATAHRGPFLFALAHGAASGDRPYAISVTGATSTRRADVPNEAASGWVRDIAFSDISRFSGAGENGELALVGRWTENFDVRVTPAADGAFALDLLYPDTGEGHVLRAHFDINGHKDETLTITVTRGASSLSAGFPNGGIASVGAISEVGAAPLRIEGARQDLHLDEAGHKVSLLYNRPVAVADGVVLRERYQGAIDFDRDGVTYRGARPIFAAALQEDARTVNLTFDHALHQNATYTLESSSLTDPVTSQPVTFPDKANIKIDNDVPAGVLYGKVLKGDNSAIAGAEVTLRQYKPSDTRDPSAPPQYDLSGSDGAFLFEFVRRQTDAGWSGAYRLEGTAPDGKHTTVEGSVRLPGKVHFVNLQFLGRGAAEGVVTYNDGTIVPEAKIVIGSTMFDQFRSTTADANGRYRIDDLPVGPLTFSASDADGNVTFAAAEIATPGQLVTQNLSIYRKPFPGTGRVYGVVTRSDTKAVVAGVHVAVYSQGYGLVDGYTDAQGRFDFGKVPSGFVTLLAAEWSVSREAVSLDFDLHPDEVKSVAFELSVKPTEARASLRGEVWRENILQPGVYERVSGALVKIEGYRIVTADDQGVFTYDDIPLSFAGRNITAYDPATQRVKNATVPTLTEAGPNTMSIFINAFDRGSGTVRVRVLNAAGAPVSGYRVIVPGYPPDVLGAVAGQPGVYELKDVPVGVTSEIWAVPNGSRPDTGTDPRPYGDQYASGKAKVVFNGHIAALTLRLPGQGVVRVKTRGQFDVISPVDLTYSVWNEQEQGTVPETLRESTEKNGEADYAVFTGIPALQNYTATSQNPAYGYASVSSSLVYDGDFNDHILQLNTLSIVRGTVYAIDGVTPVAGASVRIENGRFDPGPQLTGPDGKFEFRDQPANVAVTIIAQVTQSSVYRTGFATAYTPTNGGEVNNVTLVLRKRGFVDGRVVYRDYKRFDPDNVANNIPDDTPNDLSDNAPVPLAKFYLRELDFPRRSFGTSVDPMQADITGRFVLSNIFVGSLRATAWDSGNEELRGDWTGSIDEEGAEAAPKAYIAVGGGGVGAARITVSDPNSHSEVPNAEVSLYRGGGRAFDFSTTDATGAVQFDEIPIGTYYASAYSKSLGKSSNTVSFSVTKDNVSEAALTLEFSGSVDGTLTDPEEGNSPVPGAFVRLTASNYSTQASTDANGIFLFLGVREGNFALDTKDTDSNRRAHADRSLSVLDPHRTVNLELEPIEPLHVAVYQPDDTGHSSGVLAPPVTVEVTQRCYYVAGTRHCDYERELQGNPLQFDGVFEGSGYSVAIREVGGLGRTASLGGSFPLGTESNPVTYVWPAYGDVNVTVTQAGQPASGAKVTISGPGSGVTVYTDATGSAKATGMGLGTIYVQAVSIDGKFTGSTSTTLSRSSQPASATIALGTYAGLTGSVIAEAGGPSVGTRVVIYYGSFTAEQRTDANGRYTFLGIPASVNGTRVDLTFIGPDDTTVGAYASASVKPGDGTVTVDTVKLDATPPQIEGILPADNSADVSPDTNVTITFSEPIATSSITSANFVLTAADGSGDVSCSRTSRTLDDGKFSVTLTPARPPSGFPLHSNTLYRVIVSGAVQDLTGHPLPAPRGFTFTTSDYAEPRVLKVIPSPTTPILRATTFEFRFNEPIDPNPWQAGGSGTFHLYKLLAPGGANAAIERELVARAFVDPATNMSLFIAPDDANPIEPESFYRVVFNGVKDPQGNITPEQTYHFFSFDEIAPFVVFTNPAAGEQLVAGAEYELRIDLHNGSASGSAATDVVKVEYFTVAADGTEKPFATITASPFSTKILGPEAPESGTTLTVGAQAYDASGNQGPKTTQSWTVKPNAPPQNVVVTPLQASAYPSTRVSAAVTFEDEGSYASVTMSFSVPLTNGGNSVPVSQTISRSRKSDGTWPDFLFTFDLPNTAQAGANATFTATVADVRGATSAPVSATTQVAQDVVPPTIISVTPPAGSTYFNGNTFTLTALVRDSETTVQSVTFTVDGDSIAVASSVAGDPQKFTSASVKVKPKAEDTMVPVIVTAKDYAGNVRSTTFELLYKGVNDPAAPKVTWLCPLDRAAIPANTNNFTLPVRVRAVDQDITSVQFAIEGQTTKTGVLMAGSTTDYAASFTFATTPAPGTLTITVTVKDTIDTHTIELPITLDVLAMDYVYDDVVSITSVEAPQYKNKSIAMIGTAAVLAPQVPLELNHLLVLNGATVQTINTTTTREFKVDIAATGVVWVDCDSKMDTTAKGYVGGWVATSDGTNSDSHGRTVGNTTTGGADTSSQASHAGLGGIAISGVTNAAYGSLFTPTELGSGGGGSPNCCTQGANGGGAIAIRGDQAESSASRIVIAGNVRADGGWGFNGPVQWAGGSGGSIWLTAKQVILGPTARVTANGGDDDGSNPGSWGAGGGRVALTATTKLDLSTAAVEARGGRNMNAPEVRTVMDGGAGTIYIRKPGQEKGELRVSSYDSRYPSTIHLTRPTPLGRIGKGTSTSISANALTDTSRTFDKWMIGESIVLAGNPARTFTVTSISSDGKTLHTDPANGSMLDVATSQSVAYEGLIALDAMKAENRALVRTDQHVLVGAALNDLASMTIDGTSVVALRDDQPALTMTTTPVEGGNVVLDTAVSATYSVTSLPGVGSVKFLWSPGTAPTDTYNDFPATTSSKTISLAVPSTTPLGAATLGIEITDRTGRKFTLPTRSYTVVPNSAPVVTGLTIQPSLQVYANHDVTATVTASDDIAVKSIAIDAKLNGTSIKSVTAPFNTKDATTTLTATIPPATAGGSTLVFDVAVSDGFAGRAPTTASQTVNILTDSAPPSLTIVSPRDGETYKESVKIPVRITAVDNEVAVKEAFAQINGGALIPLTLSGTSDWRADVQVPPVDGDQAVPGTIVLIARDYAGNEKQSDPISLTFAPVIDANAPVLTWTCASPGAMYPPGYAVKLRATAVAANAQNPVQSVQMFVDDSPTSLTITSLGNNLYEATYTIPANAADGATTRVRVTATSAGGAQSDLLTSFSVAIPTVAAITANTTIDTTTTTYENQTVVITGGTVTIRGAHTFDRLMFLGGTITHVQGEKIDLKTTRATYVACDATISAVARGYAPYKTYPGASGPGGNTGGSHIGRGGNCCNASSGSTFGSVYRPQELGGGGDYNGNGGGVVAMNVLTSLVVDGAVTARGETRSDGRGGAAGSIWITTAKIGGSGYIDASGGGGREGSGGGGAIAIEYSDASSTIPRWYNNGGEAYYDQARQGAGGSTYIKGPQSKYGDLYIGNVARYANFTELPSLGSGNALTGTSGATLVTDRGADIPVYFKGHWVEITRGGVLVGTWRISDVAAKTITLEANSDDGAPSTQDGDKWQGVYRVDTLTLGDLARVDSVDPIRIRTEAKLAGSTTDYQLVRASISAPRVTVTNLVAARSLAADDMTVETGATLTHEGIPSGLTTGLGLSLKVKNTLILRGDIDVTSRGYNPYVTYPGASGPGGNTGGSHIGRGGNCCNAVSGATFGSVYRPQEVGAGGDYNGIGGGVVRIDAGTFQLDGHIVARGQTRSDGRGGAGGSIWITTAKIGGTGSIDARGGGGREGSGGGGAIAVEYTDASSSVPPWTHNTGEAYYDINRHGGAGSTYIKRAGSKYGDLYVDNDGAKYGNWTELPSFGSGTALNGSAGTTLVTDRGANIPAYFIGHWVEITRGGTLVGTWRIADVPATKTVTLEANTDDGTPDVQAGDHWQGVYRFDNVSLQNLARLDSGDPIRTTDTATLAGSTLEYQLVRAAVVAPHVKVTGYVAARSIKADDVTVETGAILTHETLGSGAPTSGLTIEATGSILVKGSIDATYRGYYAYQTYPGASGPGGNTGGSHIGRGGNCCNAISGSTFGSVYRPQEAGGGGDYNGIGGGIIRIIGGGTLQVDGTIIARGETRSDGRGGAGGSIWISVAKILGGGTIDARGGGGREGSGGGGAIAIEYTDSTSVIPQWLHHTGEAYYDIARHAAAGSTYIKGPGLKYGDLFIDNDGAKYGTFTELPSLGNGVAQDGTAGNILVTDRTANVPAYFKGHWVEITRNGTLAGTWRISDVNAKSVTLEDNSDDGTPQLQSGDKWQGVYRFDNINILNLTRVDSADPLRVTTSAKLAGSTAEYQLTRVPIAAPTITISGYVAARSFDATDMTVESGAILTHESIGSGLATTGLTFNVANLLLVKGAIDASYRGYAPYNTYPGQSISGGNTGGSHIGRGGVCCGASSGSTFGSVYRPREGGAGGDYNGYGGGIIRVTGKTLQVDGSINANGENRTDGRGGGGGSIWIDVQKISGSGAINANGGAGREGSGGGGAVSIKYSDASSTLPPTVKASTGGAYYDGNRVGAAGSVYVFNPQSVYGDATIDNTGYNRVAATQLPSIGRGVALPATSGATVVTDLPSIPAFFAGHWIDIYAPGGTRRGTWRIDTIDGSSFTLAPNGSTAADVQPGDTWRGVYLFDTLKLRNAIVQLLDDLRATQDKDANSSVTINDAPVVNAAAIAVSSLPDNDYVIGQQGAVNDLHPPIVITVTNTRTGTTYSGNAATDGSFRIIVGGIPGDTFTLVARDSYALPATSARFDVNGAITNINGVASVTLQPATTTGGTSVTGAVRLLYGTRANAPLTVTLTSSSAKAVVPASVVVPPLTSTVQFPVTTSSVTSDTGITITASTGVASQSVTLTLLAGTSSLVSLSLDASSVEGGGTVTATATLGAPAPAGGATLSLLSSDDTVASVPQAVTVPEGETTVSFTVFTRQRESAGTADISAFYGAKQTQSLTVTSCTSMESVTSPASTIASPWIDDAIPTGATLEAGSPSFDSSYAASGTTSVHFTTDSGARTFAFTAAATSPVTITPVATDALVLYALVNPCDPPRQIFVTWRDTANVEYRATWGEDLVGATLSRMRVGPLPEGGAWTRLEVNAGALGVSGKVLKEVDVTVYGGEAWIDAIGKASCSLGRAEAPPADPLEQIWFDDQLPAGATTAPQSSTETAWTWDTTQSASGTRSHVEPVRAGLHQHVFDDTTDAQQIAPGDVFFVYVLIDPCNPPKEIMLQWNSGSGWYHRAFWGEDLIGWGTSASSERYRVGPMPEAGKWVRLEVPSTMVGYETGPVTHMAFTLYDGRAWFDRVGKYSRVNVALNATATQSSTYAVANPAANVVDGDLATINHTKNDATPWIELDLGKVQPIDTISILNRTDCCNSRLRSFYLFISDDPFTSKNVATTIAQPGVTTHSYPGSPTYDVEYVVHRTGRYVRLQMDPTDYLHVREIQVWAPAYPIKPTLSIGTQKVTQSSQYDGWSWPQYAVNGLGNDRFQANGSEALTKNTDPNAWWEIDLGAAQPISEIEIVNRLDAARDRLNQAYVLISTTPFTSKVLSETLAQPGVSIYSTGANGSSLTHSFDVNRVGRYVRVQLAVPNQYLQLTEVSVWGRNATIPALSKPAPADR